MAAAGFLKSLYLRYLSKPASDRRIFTAIARGKVSRIVEVGVGNAFRARRMIEMAQRNHGENVRYTGIDLFEARENGTTGLPLKLAYQRLRATGAKVQLVPGDPFAGLARTANTLSGTQLLVVSADQDEQSLKRAWFYVPRMLSPQAVVLVEQSSEENSQRRLQQLTRAEIEVLAGTHDRRRRAA